MNETQLFLYDRIENTYRDKPYLEKLAFHIDFLRALRGAVFDSRFVRAQVISDTYLYSKIIKKDILGQADKEYVGISLRLKDAYSHAAKLSRHETDLDRAISLVRGVLGQANRLFIRQPYHFGWKFLLSNLHKDIDQNQNFFGADKIYFGLLSTGYLGALISQTVIEEFAGENIDVHPLFIDTNLTEMVVPIQALQKVKAGYTSIVIDDVGGKSLGFATREIASGFK
jgi:hypothetical protein